MKSFLTLFMVLAMVFAPVGSRAQAQVESPSQSPCPRIYNWPILGSLVGECSTHATTHGGEKSRVGGETHEGFHGVLLILASLTASVPPLVALSASYEKFDDGREVWSPTAVMSALFVGYASFFAEWMTIAFSEALLEPMVASLVSTGIFISLNLIIYMLHRPLMPRYSGPVAQEGMFLQHFN